jgi:hypothetical protein
MTRLFVAWALIFTGLLAIIVTLAMVWWPGAILFSGAACVVTGALAVQVTPPVSVSVRRAVR